MIKKILLTIILISSTRAHGMELDKNLGKWAVAVGLGIGSYLLLKKAYAGWNLDESLIKASKKGSANYEALYPSKVRFLLYAGADVHAKDDNGYTPLHYAAWKGPVEIAKLLIEAGADVNAKITQGYFQGYTPLHKAAWRGSVEIAQLLIDSGADVNAKNRDGETPLHRAGDRWRIEIAKLLIEAGADIDAKDTDGDTPLHWAALNGHAEIARLLIEAGADVNAQSKSGWTPLHWAALYNRIEVAKVLIEAGADVDAKTTQGYSQGSTPLHTAALNRRVEVAQLLIEAGAVVNANNYLRNTPLHKAAENDHDKITQLLLSKTQLPRVQGSPATFTKKDGALEILDLKSLIFLTILEDLNNIEKEEREDHLNSLRSYPDFINILENPSGNLADFCKHKHLEFLKTFVEIKNNYNETALDIAVKKKNQHLPLLLAAAGNFLNIVKAADALKDENGVNVLGIADEDLLNRLQEIVPDLEQKIDENIEEMLTFKILKQKMSLEDESID